MNKRPEKSEGKEEGVKQSLATRLVSAFVKGLLQGFFRTITFVAYLGLFAYGFNAEPKGIDLLAGPLSLIGLWMLLYNFDLVVQAAKR